MQRRVVVTGLGVLASNGIGKENFWKACISGRSGIRRITRFDPSELNVQIAGEVVGFDELAWLDKKDRRHVSRVLPLADDRARGAIAFRPSVAAVAETPESAAAEPGVEVRGFASRAEEAAAVADMIANGARDADAAR